MSETSVQAQPSDPPEMKRVAPDTTHWLVRADTIRTLWTVSIVGLLLLVLADLFAEHHPHFGLDGTFSFGAWFGFASCVVLVIAAKGLGLLLKRPEDYYDR